MLDIETAPGAPQLQHQASHPDQLREGSYNGMYDEEKHAHEKALYADETEEEEDSPFEMVRAAVSNKDNPDLPCLTFRSWVLGIIFAAALAF
ncbi:hypothetical protein LPJ59_005570, partial [Coemansia sp. RSA 2399]